MTYYYYIHNETNTDKHTAAMANRCGFFFFSSDSQANEKNKQTQCTHGNIKIKLQTLYWPIIIKWLCKSSCDQEYALDITHFAMWMYAPHGISILHDFIFVIPLWMYYQSHTRNQMQSFDSENNKLYVSYAVIITKKIIDIGY